MSTECSSMNSEVSELVRLIRGESRVFHSAPGANGEMCPTDHYEMLKSCVYTANSTNDSTSVGPHLECALVSACSDALGVFCAIQCYYSQVVAERYGESPFEIDRERLPGILAARFSEFGKCLSNLKLADSDPEGAAYRLASGMLDLLRQQEGIQI
jgi:hypothetical protein